MARMSREEFREQVATKRGPDRAKELAAQCVAAKLPEPVVEHRFHATRRWRFDLAWPEAKPKLAAEIDGGRWVGGRHTSGTGFARDAEKMTEAAILGWRILRLLPEQVPDGTALLYVRRALQTDKGESFDAKQDRLGRLTAGEVFDVWNDVALERGLPRILAGRGKLTPKVRGLLRDLGRFGTEPVLRLAMDLFARQEIVRKKRYSLANFLPNYQKYTPEAIERESHGAQ